MSKLTVLGDCYIQPPSAAGVDLVSEFSVLMTVMNGQYESPLPLVVHPLGGNWRITFTWEGGSDQVNIPKSGDYDLSSPFGIYWETAGILVRATDPAGVSGVMASDLSTDQNYIFKRESGVMFERHEADVVMLPFLCFQVPEGVFNEERFHLFNFLLFGNNFPVTPTISVRVFGQRFAP